MDLEKLSTVVNGFLPSYELRVIFFAISITLISLSLLFDVIPKKNFALKILPTAILFLVTTAIFVLPFFVENTIIQNLHVRNSAYLQIPIWILCVYRILDLLLSYLKKKGKQQKLKLKYIKIVGYVLPVITLLVIVFGSVFVRPYIHLANAIEGDTIEETANIEINFSVPVNKKNVDIHISPEQNFVIEYDNFLIFSNWVKSAQLHPVESYPPNSKIVVYVTGLSNLAPFGKSHEQSLDFFTPSLPTIESVNIDEAVMGVYTVDTDLELNLEGVDGEFVFWDVDISPEISYEIVRDSKDHIVVDFASLAQGTQYSVKIYQADRIYSVESKEDVRVGTLALVKELSFATSPAPGITGYNRKNTYLANTEPLIVDFSDKLDLESVKTHFKIEPNIETTPSLSKDGKSLVVKPKSSFTKNTTYIVTFAQGMKNIGGGYLEKDTEIEFKTPGKVYVSYFSPRNGSTGIKVSQKSVSVTFDQPVDKAFAESKFSISPAINGTLSWSGNTLYFTFASSLNYSTKYTVTMDSGIKSLYGYDSSSPYSGTFTTELETFVLNVPVYYQASRSFDCNVVATKMALAYRGISISIESMKSSIGFGQDPNSSYVDGYGVHAGPVSSYISGRRSNAVRSGWNLTALLEEVKNGNPVILFWYNGYTKPSGAISLPGGYTGYNGMHSEVVVGFTGKTTSPSTIILNDPWRGRRSVTPSTFNSLWSYLGRTAIVVY